MFTLLTAIVPVVDATASPLILEIERVCGPAIVNVNGAKVPAVLVSVNDPIYKVPPVLVVQLKLPPA